MFFGQAENFFCCNIAGENHGAIIRRVIGAVIVAEVLFCPGLDVRRPADDRKLIRVCDKRGRGHLFVEFEEVVVVDARATLGEDHFTLCSDSLCVDLQVLKPVCLYLENHVQRRARKPVLIHR